LLNPIHRSASADSSIASHVDLAFILIQLLNGLQYGLLLFLVSSGLTLVFGIMGIINLAHGSFYMVGAYLAWSLASMTGNLATAIAIAIPLTVVLGMALEKLLFRQLYTRDHLYQVLLTYGLILVFEELRSSSGATTCMASPCPRCSMPRFR
jgi:branched-chain amino acid transport system permease protein